MSLWKDVPVLVTGASGFIGSHLVRALIREGAQVYAATHTESAPWRLADVSGAYTQVVLHLEDAENIEALCARIRPHTVFHLAGILPSAQESLDAFIDTNVEGTRRVFVSAAKAGAQEFIALGSASEYGFPPLPTQEDSPTEPSSPYGVSKLEATRALEILSEEHAVRTTVFRPCAVYGEMQTPTLFIPKLACAILAHTPFHMSPGEQTLDFLYIEDLVDALMRTPARTGNKFEIINLGPGEAGQLCTVAKQIAEMLDGAEFLHIGAIPYGENEPFARCLSIEKARALLGWEPATPLTAGLKKTLAWYRKHPSSDMIA